MKIFTRTTILLLLPLLLLFFPADASTFGMLRKYIKRIDSPSSTAQNLTGFGDVYFGSVDGHAVQSESSGGRRDLSLSISLSL